MVPISKRPLFLPHKKSKHRCVLPVVVVIALVDGLGDILVLYEEDGKAPVLPQLVLTS
jgi:hypothetical protein